MPSASVGFVGISLRIDTDFSVLDDSDEEELAYGEIYTLEG